MPVIDFTATWRDTHNHIVPHGTTSVSIYLVYYVIVVVVLTLATMEAWWYWRNHAAKSVWKRFITLICISHTLEYVRQFLKLPFLNWRRAKAWYKKKQSQGTNVIV